MDDDGTSVLVDGDWNRGSEDGVAVNLCECQSCSLVWLYGAASDLIDYLNSLRAHAVEPCVKGLPSTLKLNLDILSVGESPAVHEGDFAMLITGEGKVPPGSSTAARSGDCHQCI